MSRPFSSYSTLGSRGVGSEEEEKEHKEEEGQEEEDQKEKHEMTSEDKEESVQTRRSPQMAEKSYGNSLEPIY